MVGKAARGMRGLFRSTEERAEEMKAKYRTPIWRISSKANQCIACHIPLDGLVLPNVMRETGGPRRFHHCRWCGEIFCSDCTQSRAVVRNGEVARVCTACAAEIGKPSALHLDPFVAMAVAASRQISNRPSPIMSIITEPVLLSRACAAIFSLLALSRLLPMLVWNVSVICLIGWLQDTPEASTLLLGCSVIGDCFMIGLGAAAAFQTLSVMIIAACLCELSALVRSLRRLLLFVRALMERFEEEEENEDEPSVYSLKT